MGDHSELTRREREIMDIIYRKGSASVAEVQKELSGNPSYSTVRSLMHILEEKRILRHRDQNTRFVYYPVTPKKTAVRNAVKGMMKTFFNDSIENAVAALLEFDRSKLTGDELDRLSELIEKARKEEKGNE